MWWFRMRVGRGQDEQPREWLRALLSALLERPASSLQFSVEQHGKPTLADEDTPVHFNLSHSGEWCVIAASRTHELGVDVERIDPARPQARLAKRFFSASEQAAYERGQVSFFEVWTRKEACIKACGQGVARGLACFDSGGDGFDATWQSVLMPERAGIAPEQRVMLRDLEAPQGYAAALALVV